MSDLIERQVAIDAADRADYTGLSVEDVKKVTDEVVKELKRLPSTQPERLTDDDFETIRIHLNSYKEKLCNQKRWEEAEEYQRIIDRFMAFASAQSEQELLKDGTLVVKTDFDMTKFDRVNVIQNGTHYGDSFYQDDDTRRKGKWIYYDPNGFKCSRCGRYLEIGCGDVKMNFCPNCGADMRETI